MIEDICNILNNGDVFQSLLNTFNNNSLINDLKKSLSERLINLSENTL